MLETKKPWKSCSYSTSPRLKSYLVFLTYDTSDVCSIFYYENAKTEIQENKSPKVGDDWLDNH